jgi:hypothetical protein
MGRGQCACRTPRHTKQVSGTAKIDPLMAAFNAIAWMPLDPASTQPSIFRIEPMLDGWSRGGGLSNACLPAS